MKPIIILSIFLGTLSLYGQKNVSEKQWKINVLPPSVSYEMGIAKNATLSADIGFGFGLRGGSERTTEFGIFPLAELGYRYYYNMDRRLENGKNISGNTGNYIGPLISYISGTSIFGDLSIANQLFVGPVYGLQRTYKKGFSFNVELGAGYFENDVDGGLGVFVGFELGWVLRRNK